MCTQVTWLNAIFAKLHPRIASTLQVHFDTELRKTLEDSANAYAPYSFKIKIETLTLGTIAPTFSEVYVRDTGNHNNNNDTCDKHA
jgi:hypothetical protein